MKKRLQPLIPTLCVVEDDLLLLEGWQDLFTSTGYQVHAFRSVAAALKRPQAVRQSHVALVDYNLPDYTGTEFVRQARKLNPDLPAIIITGLSADYVAQEVAGLDNVRFFRKPATIAALESALDHMVGLKGADMQEAMNTAPRLARTPRRS